MFSSRHKGPPGTKVANQISSWWGGSGSSAPAIQDKPYDPTDPKQNPLNPKGLKPCVILSTLVKLAADDGITGVARAQRPSQRGTTAF